MSSEIKVVLFLLTISALLGFTQVPIVSATSTSNPSIFEILSSGDITFVGSSTTKMIIIGPPDFVHFAGVNTIISGNGQNMFILTNETPLFPIFAPVLLPDGATITEFECKVKADEDAKGDVTCSLYEIPYAGGETQISFLTTTQHLPGIQTLTSSPLNYPVDRDSNRYHAQWELTNGGCGANCRLVHMKITYTVPSGFAIGGNFYPVDNVSLVLAYGLVNSWWMAPIGIGIGVGIYLVKRKIE